MDESDRGAFAKLLHAAVEATGLSQRAVAEALGVPKRTMEAWLASRRVPPAFTRQSLLDRINALARESKD